MKMLKKSKKSINVKELFSKKKVFLDSTILFQL